MKNIQKLYIVLVIITFLTGCDENFLDRPPLDRISSDAVASNQGYAESYVFDLYSFMPCGYPRASGHSMSSNGYGWTSLIDQSTGIAVSKSGWVETQKIIVAGKMSPTKNPYNNWGNLYSCIYRANDFIGILEQESKFDADVTARLIAEARFIRACQYFDLARRWGDVPLITATQNVDDPSSLLVSRTPVNEIYDFIDKEFVEAALVLPSAKELNAKELGRATKEAAWAFNGRAQLFAKEYARSAEMSKKVIDNGYFVLADDYNALFQSHGGNKEVIFEVLFNGAEKGHGIDQLALPFSFRADWGSQMNPTQEFVDEYETLKGLPISDPNSGYDPKNPYENRDKRLSGTVLYQDAPFMGRKMDVIFPDGIDAPLRTGLHSISGYYITKFIDQSAPFGIKIGEGQQSWKEMRLAEVLLNYAEAMNEAVGPDASVYQAMNEVRNRSGLPNLPSGLSKSEMFERVKHERLVELALEGHRFWDIRRWRIAEQLLHNKIWTGMKVYRESDGSYRYERFPMSNRPTQIFLPKHYLFPIPQGEINKNPNLTQNKGY